MRVGQTRIFLLTERTKVTSARVTCQQLKNEYDLDFDFRPDYDVCAACITRVK